MQEAFFAPWLLEWSPAWRDFFRYITGGAHQAFYLSFGLIILTTFLGAAITLALGIAGAGLARARNRVGAAIGRLYINMVRGIPDVLFFLFFPLLVALSIKIARTWLLCAPGTPLFIGINFEGCAASNFLGSPDAPLTFLYNYTIACVSLGLVYGAFAANVIRGGLDAVPAAQLETARAYGFSERQVFWRVQVPQMWVYAWGGLTNIWMLIIKATSLLSLLGIQEAVWWTLNKLGPPQPRASVGYVRMEEWAVYYFTLLLLFYLLFTSLSERGFARAKRHLVRGLVSA